MFVARIYTLLSPAISFTPTYLECQTSFPDLRNKIYAQPNRGPLAPALLTHTHAICMSSPALDGTAPPRPRPLATDESGVEGPRGQSSLYDKLWYSAVSVAVQMKLILRSSLLYVVWRLFEDWYVYSKGSRLGGRS